MSNEKRGFAFEVSEHYNQVEQKSIRERSKSAIIELRRFNNAMKSVLHYLVHKYITLGNPVALRILDLGCGKGGDLPKYFRSKNEIEFVAGVDIADISIEQCKERYKSMREHSLKTNNECFKSLFFVADLTRLDIKKKLNELNCTEPFHIASSQFNLHYSFESFEQCVRYIRNASENLAPLGIFMGTYTDGTKLLKLARESKTPGLYEVDDLMSVTFKKDDLENPKPFGTQYHFKLKEVVDCPEFLVHPEVLRKLMEQLGFASIYDKSFESFLKDAIANRADGEKVKNIFNDFNALKVDSDKNTATLDENMWKVASIYRCFIYRKK